MAYDTGVSRTDGPMTANDAFLLFFRGLARHAPGADEATLRALELCELPDAPVVYDFGAGTGSSTLVLAEALQSEVVAVDLLARSLDEAVTRAERRGIEEWVETLQGDFMELDIEPGSVDLIWSEGAIYSVGWERALEAWAEHLTDGGYLVASDAVWVDDRRPDDALEFWNREYPAMKTEDEIRALATSKGYEVVATFELPAHAWSDYYGPLAQRVALVDSSDPSDEMREVVDAVREEIDVWETHGHVVDYVFFVLRR